MQLLYELAEITSKVWNKIQRKGVLHQSMSSVCTETMTGPAPPSSPVKSSVGTIPPDTSTYSPSADIGTTTEVLLFLKKMCCVSSDLRNVVVCSQGRIRKIRRSSTVQVESNFAPINWWRILYYSFWRNKRERKNICCIWPIFIICLYCFFLKWVHISLWHKTVVSVFRSRSISRFSGPELVE